jgi:gliding motility-associated-like protein
MGKITPKHTIVLKKFLLVTLSLLLLFNLGLTAANRYWVGGTGSWNEAAHWSAASGGPGGALVPTVNDDVFFDQHSFSAANQRVMLTSNGFCRNMSWAGIDKKIIFAGVIGKKLTVSGSYSLSPLLTNGFKGLTEFTSSLTGNAISTFGVTIYGDWTFNGTGAWMLNDDLSMDRDATVRLTRGSFNSNSKHIACGSFIGSSFQMRALDLGTSEVIVRRLWDFEFSSNLTVHAENSMLMIPDSSSTSFKPGGMRIGGVGVTIQSQNSVTCVFPQFTITLTADSVRCNSFSDGAAHVVVTGGSGAPVFDWNFAATPTGDGTANITGLSASTNTVKVTEIIGGVTVVHFCSISVGEPPPLNDFEALSTTPTCFGVCNGFIDVDETGGTPPYTYTWSGGLGNNDTAINVCAGTYTATVTDSRGCRDSSAIVAITQPSLLVAPGNANMVSCNGFCNGSATVSPSGGTPGYTYVWASINTFTGQGTPTITNLCPGNYTVTVTDTNGCTATFDTTITQPPVLTLALSHTNATCGGVCNGTATATVSGGTPPYIYSWSNGSVTNTASTTNTVSSLCAGMIVIAITDANGCTKVDSVIITEPAILVATATGIGASCFGICDGTATAVVSGGTIPYNYNWNGSPVGDGTPNVSGLCAGSYTVTVGDLNGCSDTGIVTITEPALLIPNPTSTNVLCFGDLNGTATAAPTGGTFPYSYNWTPGNPAGDGTPTITGLGAGNYCITVTDAHGCDTMECVTVTQPPALTVSITKTNVQCNAACDGTATANPSGGTPGYTYSWTGPAGFTATTQSISGLCPGIYTVTVKDANNCIKTQTVTITQPNVLNATLSATVLLCNGDCNATITSTISGGTPPYSFSWAPGGQTTSSITNQCAGVYTLTVTDANNCVKVVSITVTQPTPLTVITSSTNVTCFGLCNGTASVIAGGGTPGYTYSWSPGGATTSSVSGLCAGMYTVTVKDANNCTMTGTVTITSPPQLFGNPGTAVPISCSGVCDGSVTSAPSGGTPPYSYNWLPGNPPGDGTPTITSLCAGTYSLITTDANSCTSNQSVVLTQPAPLTSPITGSTSSCNVCNGTATVTASGGTPPYNYLWSDGTGQTTPTAVGLCPNVTYTVVVTDAHNCTASSSVTISQTITITITTSNTTLSCFGVCDGIVTANAAGGQVPYSFLWVGGSPPATVGLTQTVTNLCAGTYTVTVVDANGCLNTDTVTFTNPPILDVTATHTNASCGATCDGTATGTATGGTGVYSYSWNDPAGQTTATANGLCAGTYILTVTDANGCTDTVSVIITEPPPVVDNPTISNANCLLADGTITVAPTGGTGAYNFIWGPGVIAGQGTPTASALLPGAYTLQITDFAGCAYNFNYLISNINGPTLVMAHTNPTCNNSCNGTATVTASGGAGGFIYDWSPNATGDGTPVITGLCGTATYSVTVTDAAGCITIDTATIFNPILISPHQVVINESCGGSCNGSITLAPTGGAGGYTYAWTPAGLPATASQASLCMGVYTVTITDASNCDTTITINITAPPVLNVTISSTNVLCASACNGTATATATGGAGGYTYAWLPNPPLGPTFPLPNLVNLCPMQYFLTVTDANGCTAKDTVDITEPAPLTTVTSHTNASCNGLCDGVAVVTPSGGTPGYSFLWSLAGLPNNDTASALCAGTYNVTVSDLNGCTSSPLPIVITEPPPIVPNVTFTNSTCNNSCNGTALAAPTGGTSPYTYSWGPGVITGNGTPSVTNLCAGALALMVTDSLGCTNTQNITLIDPPVLSANPASTSPTCINSCNGSVTATPSGGTSGYTYSWSPGSATTQTVINLCPNVYTVIVTDANNCLDTQTVAVVNPLPIDIAVSSTPANCGVCDGTITVNPITGTPGYTYLWSPAPTAGQGTPNATSVCAGLYDITVTDVNGCDSTFTLAMNNSGGVTGETVSTMDASCFGVCNGSGSVVPVGGVPPYSYLWNDVPPTANDTAMNLCAGNYFVAITDSNVCIHFSPVTINEPAPILSNATVTSAICSNVCNGVISLAASGGTPGYTYVWAAPSPGPIAGQGTPTVTGLCPGTYTVTITDNNGCVKTDSFIVSQSTPLTVTAASSNITCSNANTGTAYITISSGTAPFTIQWDDPAGQTNDTATALAAGVYTATITDANGCFTTASATVTSSPAVAVNATVTNATCGVFDGSAVAAPSGGTAPYSFLWSNGQTIANATGLGSGLYTVNITDNAGCVSSFSIPVSNTSGPSGVAITSTNIACNGGTGAVTAVTPSGGTAPYSYLWIQGGQTTPTLSGLSAGVYYLQVADSSGCSIVDSVTITEPAAIDANQVVTAATCGVNDGAITLTPTGGVPSYTYLWNTGPVTSSISGLSAGVYSVQITDAVGCAINVVIPVNSQNGPSLTMSSTNVSCSGMCNGTATVTTLSGVAPFSYLWNDVGVQTTPAATALCEGNYAVVVTGANGCVSVAMLSITEPDSIGFSLSTSVDPLCNGDTTGSIAVIPSGGTLGYTYAWSPSGGTAAMASNLGANTYTVTVTDAQGCTATQSTTLVQTTALTISSVVTNPSCNTLTDGSIDVTVTGGAPVYAYQWSGASTAITEDLSGLDSGTFMITVTDGNGCTISDTSMLIPNQSIFVFAGNDTTFCQNGSIMLVANSTNGITFQWFELPAGSVVGAASSVSVTPPPGTTAYYVTTDNGSGCTASDTLNVTSNVLPTASAGSDATIVIGSSTVIGGSPTASPGTSINWNPIPYLDNATASNPTATPAATTTYTVSVTTPEGCTVSDSVLVTVLPAIVIPDGISPNGDGDNDEWIIDGIELFPNCVVEVYNRWGELLFQSVGYKEHWKGTYKGEELPVGSYYYIVDLKDPLFPDAYTGPITILR